MYEKCIKCDRLGAQCFPALMRMEADDLVSWCKRRKEFLDMTNLELSEKSGVPLSTVNRFYSRSYAGFRYDTIHPIVCALTGYTVSEDDCPSSAQDSTSLEEVKAQNETLRLHIQGLQSSFDKELDAVRAEGQRKVDFLKDQLTAQQDINRKQRRSVTVCTVVIALYTLLVFGLLLADRFMPGVGFIWR